MPYSSGSGGIGYEKISLLDTCHVQIFLLQIMRNFQLRNQETHNNIEYACRWDSRVIPNSRAYSDPGLACPAAAAAAAAADHSPPLK